MNGNNMTPTEYATHLISKGYTMEEVVQIMRKDGFLFPNVSAVLNEMLGKKEMSVEVLAGLAGMNPTTVYRILNRKRNPSRNGLIRLAMAMGLSLNETQILIKSGNCAPLSGTKIRDLIIMDGIMNHKDYDTVNESLREKGFNCLDS